MKVLRNGRCVDYRAVWFEKGLVKMIDQRVLPASFRVFTAKTLSDNEFAIREMVVRGAPSIGAAAAYAMAQAVIQKKVRIESAAKRLKSTRPTAYDLFYAVDYMLESIHEGKDPVESAMNYANSIIDECIQIGMNGAHLLKDGCRVMTHCNAGALATVDFGTALAPIRVAQEQGRKPFVFVSETRPRLQGARLTAWELKNEGIRHVLIPDSASGHFMKNGDVDIVITGADRVAANGDAANKIGTYEKAVLAKENGIPFYIAVPRSSVDTGIKSGDDIIIEERRQEEVLKINGKLISANGVKAKNPSFDVTPARYITGIITKNGIFKPSDVVREFGNRKR